MHRLTSTDFFEVQLEVIVPVYFKVPQLSVSITIARERLGGRSLKQRSFKGQGNPLHSLLTCEGKYIHFWVARQRPVEVSQVDQV